ncbi:MAG: ATP-dependent 6-phosphofructokinase [Candidatus Pacebacteria bacterium]|nr:ATP-dependent 6-phosphofructokinase [Candidatus Paceibacterota bacterium]
MSTEYQQLSVDEVAALDFSIDRTGEATLDSPVEDVTFVDDATSRVSFFSDTAKLEELAEKQAPFPSFEKAGPRANIFHDPPWTRAAIVTCGGLCPGINDVIKGLVNTLYYVYGVDNVYGIRYGFRGLVPRYGLEPMTLNPDNVDTIHENGGSVLGSSRGPQDVDEMVRTLDRLSINVLFTVGGDGTQRGAGEIAEAARSKGLPLSVVGIPKTIDNDLSFMDRTFGFETAVYASGPVINSAHDEAKGAYNGIGLVKLMGRHSGFIAAASVLANSVANFCLIPEVPFQLEGDKGLLQALEKRFEKKQHAVIVVAEGAGQNLFDNGRETTDASGNVRLNDIGELLKTKVTEHFKKKGLPCSVKYFEPSYLIRSIPARGTDAIFCLHLAENAVHAAMSGRTNMVVGYWEGDFTHVPIQLAAKQRRQVNPQSQLWRSVNDVTQQTRYW